MILIYCLILTTSIVYVYDFLNFPREFLARIYSIILKEEVDPSRIKLPKLLECSLCASNWSTLILLLILNWKLAPLCLLFSWSTRPIYQIINILDKLIHNILAAIEKWTETAF